MLACDTHFQQFRQFQTTVKGIAVSGWGAQAVNMFSSRFKKNNVNFSAPSSDQGNA